MKSMLKFLTQWTPWIVALLMMGCAATVSNSPKDARSKGQAALHQGRIDDAIQAFKTDAKANPGNADSLRLLARAYQRKGNFAKAIAALKKVVKANPTDATGWKTLGQMQFALGHYKHAQISYANAQSVGDLSAQTAAQLAKSQLNLKQASAALKTVGQALDHYPQNSQLHLTKGLILRVLHKPDEAVVAFRYAARLNTKSAEAPLEAASTYEQMGFPKRAVKYYQEAIKRQPDHPKSSVSLGRMLIQAGKVQEAIPILVKAARLDPDNAIIQNNLGVAYSASGYSKKAVSAYKTAIKQGLKSPAVHSNLAEAHYLTGEFKNAERALRQVLKMDPSRQLDQAALRRVVLMAELLSVQCKSATPASAATIKSRVQKRWVAEKWKESFQEALISLQQDKDAMVIMDRAIAQCSKVSPASN